VTVRTLLRRIVLRTDDGDLHQALRYLECEPEIEGYAAHDHDIRIEPHRGSAGGSRYRIIEEGGEPREELTSSGVVQYLHRRVFLLSIEDRPQSLVLHTACLRNGGRRILLVGTEGAGKTTLTLRLMLAGYQIEGDENVFIDGRGVIARPRALRVKERALAHLPEIAERIAAAPFLTDLYGRKIYNLSPGMVGAPWQIQEGAVDLLVLLRPNHGGASSLRRLGALAVGRELLAEIAFPETGRGAAVAALAGLTARARAFDMSLGNSSQAIDLIDRLFATL
jgi:hypothetical protein